MARVAFIVANDFEDSEFREPYERLRRAGHEVTVIGSEAGTPIQGKKGKEKIVPDTSIDRVSPSDYDALVIPGGYSPDRLRMDRRMVDFTRGFFDEGKPVAAVCHAPWMLVEAGIARDRTVTSWPSIRTDLVNAGARWVDQEVVEDGPLITSRKPEDLPAFSAAILHRLDAMGPRRPDRSMDMPATNSLSERPAI
ncbi:MAG TPA: type 1 glutamine amidotransferase domain-containing protein [Candidatus Eisenbacteria bacterium]|nr:type 1 glutamine amidotransferase domain-containing protein [Candidatus Eisenbacteria bacterium]